MHKTFSWHGYFWGSPFATQNSRLKLLIIFLRTSLQDLVSHSFEQEHVSMVLFKDQIRKSGSNQARFERMLSVQGDSSECPGWSISFPDSSTSPFATVGPDLIREEKQGCWSSLESWCEEGECLRSDPGWKLRIMACTWTINRDVQPELRHRVASKIWSLLTLEPSFIANLTGGTGGTEMSCFLLLWQPEGQVQQHVHSVKLCCAIQWNCVAPARPLQHIATFYCHLPFHNLSGRGWVRCRSTPGHNDNNGCYNSRACRWKRQCLSNQPGPALFMQV